VGQASSAPYLRREIGRLGKSWVEARSYSPEVLASLKGQFDCLLICGSQGNYPIEVPAVAVMRASGAWLTRHIDNPEPTSASFKLAKGETPQSGRDWYYCHELDRERNARQSHAVRVDATRKAMRENAHRRRELIREIKDFRCFALDAQSAEVCTPAEQRSLPERPLIASKASGGP
jgi:hypothetical protein